MTGKKKKKRNCEAVCHLSSSATKHTFPLSQTITHTKRVRAREKQRKRERKRKDPQAHHPYCTKKISPVANLVIYPNHNKPQRDRSTIPYKCEFMYFNAIFTAVHLVAIYCLSARIYFKMSTELIVITVSHQLLSSKHVTYLPLTFQALY